MALPQTTHDQGIPINVDIRLDMLTNQRSSATTAIT